MSTRVFCRSSRTALVLMLAGLCLALLITGASARGGFGLSIGIGVPLGHHGPIFNGGYYHYPGARIVAPLRYGHWMFGGYNPAFACRSAYYYYGALPYVEVARVHRAPYVSVGYVGAPVMLRGDYYLARNTGAETPVNGTLSDIRTAWIDGRADLIKSHVDKDKQIAVLLDGKYDYSVDSTDYISMTTDAIGQLHTQSFTWERVQKRTNGDFTAFGKHTYKDAAGLSKTVYVSYTLRAIGRNFVIVEVGSSTRPLQ